MRDFRPTVLLVALCVASGFVGRCYAADQLAFLPKQDTATASVNVQISFTIVAVDTATGLVDKADNNALTVSSTDGSSTITPTTLALSQGSATVSIIFKTPGNQIVSAASGGALSAQQPVAVTSAIAGCSSCYATIGAGAVITNLAGDYNNTNNVLETTHLGNSTPQYVVGVAYKLPIRGELYKLKPLGCNTASFTTPTSDASAAYCFPYKAFINFKFTPDASQTFNGFTYGISHAIHKDLDILLGVSYSAYNEVSPGFQAAALQVVKEQQSPSTGSTCYAQWNLASLQADSATAYDGFPTQLLTQTGGTVASPICTAGAQIYGGSPLAVHYHAGLFIGISVPISFSTFLGGK